MKPKKSPPAKGQGTLFSFFSKKEPTNTDQSIPKPKPKPEQSTLTAKTQPSTPKGPANKPVSQPRAQANLELSSLESAELVGKRIKVFWRDDDNWYFGKVVDFSGKDGTHLVHYDDGDKEKVVLANEKVTSPCCVAPYLWTKLQLQSIYSSCCPNPASPKMPPPLACRSCDVCPNAFCSLFQFELAPEPEEEAEGVKRVRKSRPKAIQDDDDDEVEWDQDQLQGSGDDDDGSTYEVRMPFMRYQSCVCCPTVDISYAYEVSV